MENFRPCVIVKDLPDGINYNCGRSKINLGGQEIIGNEYSLFIEDAQIFFNEEIARGFMQKFEPEEQLFRILHVSAKDFLEKKFLG